MNARDVCVGRPLVDDLRVKPASLYPLRGLPRQGQIWSWISFDVANQSFALIINTLLFSVFFTEVVVQNEAIDDRLWSMTNATAMLLVVLASPIAGAISDARAWKKQCLVGSGLIAAALTCALALIEPRQLWLAWLIYIPASFMCSVGDNFLGSFLPEVAERERFGRVSGFSWAIAYSAALVLLALTLTGMVVFDLREADEWRPFFVFAGLWFFAFALPTLLWLRERAKPAEKKQVNVWTAGFRRLLESARQVRRFRDVAMLLAASMFYGAAMNVIIFFASILAREFGFRDTDLVLFIAVITVSGVVGTLLPTFFQDKVGHRRMTLLLLLVWIGTTAGLIVFTYLRAHAADPAAFPRWPLWIFGNLLGFGLGSLGSANRAFFGYVTPASRTGEFFGLWGVVFKLAAFLTLPFAIAKDEWGTPTALGVLMILLLIGTGLTWLIDEQRGLAAARAEDQAQGTVAAEPGSAS